MTTACPTVDGLSDSSAHFTFRSALSEYLRARRRRASLALERRPHFAFAFYAQHRQLWQRKAPTLVSDPLYRRPSSRFSQASRVYLARAARRPCVTSLSSPCRPSLPLPSFLPVQHVDASANDPRDARGGGDLLDVGAHHPLLAPHRGALDVVLPPGSQDQSHPRDGCLHLCWSVASPSLAQLHEV